MYGDKYNTTVVKLINYDAPFCIGGCAVFFFRLQTKVRTRGARTSATPSPIKGLLAFTFRVFPRRRAINHRRTTGYYYYNIIISIVTARRNKVRCGFFYTYIHHAPSVNSHTLTALVHNIMFYSAAASDRGELSLSRIRLF